MAVRRRTCDVATCMEDSVSCFDNSQVLHHGRAQARMVRLDGRQLRPQRDNARGPRQTLQGSSICDSLEKMLSSSQVVYKHGSASVPVPAAVNGTSSCMNQVKTGENRWMSHEGAAGSSEHTL